MAGQFHVAHSAMVNGAALLAGGPYYCAEASIQKGLGPCIKGGDTGMDGLIAYAVAAAAAGSIDSINNLNVLGAIMFGIATPTEAAAVGAFGAVVLAAGYRSLTWQGVREAVYLTARTSAMVCWLFVGSATFASVFAYLGGEGLIKETVLGMDLSPVTFLLLSQFIIFLLGWPLEWTEIIIIFVPIFLPMLPHFQVDPLLFGVLVALNLQTAFLSPPMAMAAYYL
jgi:TRAP-type mannitol/chloroaromatic compound transport system permease large subunit